MAAQTIYFFIGSNFICPSIADKIRPIKLPKNWFNSSINIHFLSLRPYIIICKKFYEEGFKKWIQNSAAAWNS